MGNVDCNGNESNLRECSHLTESDEVVSQCDPKEKAAVACQGKCIFMYDWIRRFKQYLFQFYPLILLTVQLEM